MGNSGSTVFLIILSIISFLLSWYVFQAIRTLIMQWENPLGRTIVAALYWLLSGIYMLNTIFSFRTIFKLGEISGSAQTGLNIFLTVTVTQVVIIFFLLGEDLIRGVQGINNYLSGKLSQDHSYIPQRRKFVSQLALMVASIPFAGFVYGVWRGKYNFKVFKETIYFEDLPDAFDGFTITQ